MAGRLDMKGKKLGGYTIVDRLGVGGMGAVYKARDEDLDRFVAIKVLAPAMEDDPVCVKRFQREARSIAALRHPNLMHVYSVGEEDGLHFFAMEYIEGKPLSKLIAERGKLGVDEALQISGMIMGALHKVHCADIIHRDLKPGNVMMDADGRAVLVDFGLSKDTTAMDLTSAGAIMGTPDYMAPEQIEAEEVGPVTDIYAMGVMLYEMLTGTKPFHRKSAVMTMRAHCESRPAPLTSLRPDLPKIMDAILEKAMARDPAKRYQSIPAMANDLARVAQAPALMELAREFSAPSSAATIVNEPSQVSASQARQRRGAKSVNVAASLHAPTIGAAATIPAVEQQVKAQTQARKKKKRRKSTRSAKPVAAPAPSFMVQHQRLLFAAGAVILLLFGIALGWRWRRRKAGGSNPRQIARERYGGQQVQGVDKPRVEILTRGGRYFTGILLKSGKDGLRIRKDKTGETVLLDAGEIRILRPALGSTGP